MDVFVESNFVLELAFTQQEQTDCAKLLLAAKQGAVQLHLPVYCLTEVFQTSERLRKERDATRRILRNEIGQHLREENADAQKMEVLDQMLTELLEARTRTQAKQMFEVTTDLAASANLIQLSAATMRRAQQAQLQHELSPQDALVYASVLIELEGLPVEQEKIFMTRNKADFDKELLAKELDQFNCKLFFRFSALTNRLRLN